jgi:lambda repressor-like predicted transcriptional regulator
VLQGQNTRRLKVRLIHLRVRNTERYSDRYTVVELLFLYWTTEPASKKLSPVWFAAVSQQRPPNKGVATRQVQRRLSEADAYKLVAAYRQGAGVKELAKHFGIHRDTVSEVLKRAGVVRRTVGLSTPDITTAAELYRAGWSLVRLGEKFGVDGTTGLAGLAKKWCCNGSPNERTSQNGPLDVQIRNNYLHE